MATLILKNALIADGYGGEPYRGDILVRDGIIAEVRMDSRPAGTVHADDYEDEAASVIDCKGRVVSPGFIDIHSHGDLTAAAFPDMESCVLQGITTIFGGQCGMSAAPADRYWRYTFFEDRAFEQVIPAPCGGQIPGRGQLLETERLREPFRSVFEFDLDWTHVGEYYDHLDRTGIGANILTSVGHGMIRNQVMGTDDRREATQDEIDRMAEILRREIANGAAGMSYGLDYECGVYASDDELLQLAAVLAECGGLLTTHCQRRNWRHGEYREQHYIDGVREVLEIARRTGVRLHISHLAGGYEGPPEPTDEISGTDIYAGIEKSCRAILDLIESYRDMGVHVTYDVIPEGCGGEMFHLPYLAGKFEPYVDWCGGFDGFRDALRTGSYRRQLADEIRAGRHRSVSPFTRFDPGDDPEWGDHAFITECKVAEWAGRRIADIAEEFGMDVTEAMLEILADDPRTMYSTDHITRYPGADIYTSLPDASVCLDGALYDYGWPPDDGRPCIFPAPSHYSGMVKFLRRELDRGAGLGETIAKMTGNSAAKIGFNDRGWIAEGMAADLVVFDPETLDPGEARTDPRVAPAGIDYVLVNGVIEADHGKAMHRRAGRTLRGTFGPNKSDVDHRQSVHEEI